jgi:hypothetical protein
MKCQICAAILTLAVTVSSYSDTIVTKGKEIIDKNSNAVVTLQLVIKQKVSFGGSPSQEDESKAEATGTVISPDGLTLVSLSQTDPTVMLEAMMAGNPQLAQLNMESEIQDAKLVLEDGTEIDAEIILRDKDLDMAFARPLVKPEKPLDYIDLNDSADAAYLEQVITLNRLGKVAKRVHAASVERISAIVEKPRKFYIPGNDPTQTGLGSPAFSLDGKIIGVFVMKTAPSSGGGLGGMMGGGIGNNVMSIILPAIDILDAVAQVPPFKE